MNARTCPLCGHHAAKPRARTFTGAKRGPAPSYKGGWPRSGYVALNAPPIDWAHRSLIAATLGNLGGARPEQSVTVNGREIPNATIDEVAA